MRWSLRWSLDWLLLSIPLMAAYFLGWGLRSCGLGDLYELLVYAIRGPVVSYHITVPVLVAAFILGGFFGIAGTKSEVSKAMLKTLAYTAVSCAALGFFLRSPGGCGFHF
jgi:hypothetical protein